MLTSANSSEIDPLVKACLTLNEDILVRSIDGKVALKIFVVYVTKMKKLVRYIRFGGVTPCVRAYIRLRKFLIFSSKEFFFFRDVSLRFNVYKRFNAQKHVVCC